MTEPAPSAAAPLISVIVPVWNVEAHVAACLESLRAQTLGDFEAIVVDDGSTDESLARARAAAGEDARFRFLERPNGGLSAARNTGLAAARGDFIAFVDSDDTVEPEYLAALHDVLAESGADWVACAVRFVEPGGRAVVHSAIHGAPALPEDPSPLRFDLACWTEVIRHYPSAWNKLYRRSLISETRFDEGTYYEDHAFFWQLAARTDQLLWLPRPLYRQTQGRAGQITRDGSERVFEQFTVLDRLTGIARASGRAGVEEALARIATRLSFERSTAIAEPDRRRRFAEATAAWFAAQGLAPSCDWDAGIARAWVTRIGGQMPVSVVVPTEGDAGLLGRTLESLAGQRLRDVETIVVPDIAAAEMPEALAEVVAAALPEARMLPGAAEGEERGVAAARNRGLTAATGTLVVFLDAGDRLLPGALADWAEGMLRTGAQMGAAPFRMDNAEAPHNGFHDMRGLAQRLKRGRFAFDPEIALRLHAHPSAKIFRRDFLLTAGLRFAPGPLPSWGFVLEAALRAGAEGFLAEAAGVEIATAAEARQFWRAPVPPGDLLAAIEALADGLPGDLAARLPAGWQRRLFARALWEKLTFAAPDAATAEAWEREAADLMAARFAGQRGALDPFLGPRLGEICAAAASRPPQQPHGLGDCAGPKKPPIPRKPPLTARGTPLSGTETVMQSFRTRDGASLFYEVDFRDIDYANISFFDRSRKAIVFHLSLRLSQGLAVCNRRLPAGWEGERPHSATLHETGDAVEIRFDAAGGVTVLLGEAELCRYDAADFDRLDEIACFDFQGGIVAASLRMTGPSDSGRNGQGDLRLRAPMTLEGWAWDPEGGAEQKIEIDIEGLEAGPATMLSDRPDLAALMGSETARLGITAVLPGRVWQALPDLAEAAEPTLLVQPRSNGIPCGAPLEIGRSEICAQVEAIATAPEAERDTTALLLAIEHTRFARLWPALSEAAREGLMRAAETFRVTEFLFAPDAATDDETITAGVRPALPRPDPHELLLGPLRDGFVETLRAHPETDLGGLLDERLRKAHYPDQVRRDFYLALTETFCRRDAFETLFARAAADGLTEFAGRNEAWFDSTIVPFLFQSGKLEEVRDILWQLVNAQGQWVVTPAIAWMLHRLITRAPDSVSEKMREEILYAFIALVDKRSPDYWERSTCSALVETAVELLVHADRFADYMQRDIRAFALRSYGLSRAFWEQLRGAVAAGRVTLSGELAAAEAAFGQIEARLDGAHADIGPALRLFEALKCSDAERLRLELLGPAGVLAEPGTPLMATLISEGRDLHEAALRGLAMPGAAGEMLRSAAEADAGALADLTALARRAVADRHDAIPKASFHGLQISTSRAILELLGDLAAGRLADGALAAKLDVLIPQLTTLARVRSRFLGLRLEIGLVGALIRHGALAEASRLLGHLGTLRAALTEEEIAQLATAPALQGALFRMRRIETDTGAPLAGAVLQLFAETVATLPVETDFSDEADPAWHTAPELFDTLVVVLSCQAYLDTRIPALRAGWLSTLEALGVPYIIAVGGGDGRREGDIVYLDAPDDYEGLPQKTLATVRWVHDNTPFAHMIKIDDDCFLNAEEYFHSHSHTKFDYHGRALTRQPGQMDRTWHTAKSNSLRGRFELDKSPEPSTYADGGSGYSLSRRAMAQLLGQSETPEGQLLIANSFMEDKMVGDLLAPSGIRVSDEDYYVAVQRRTHAGAIPVALWVNSFHASRAAGIKLAHLDSHKPQAEALEQLNRMELRPRKIWPSYMRSRLVFESNALELVSDEVRLARLAAAPVAVVACMRNEMFMLPHFLAHYRAMGVEAFLIADNLSDDGTLEFLAEQHDVALFSVDTTYSAGQYGVAWQQALLAHYRLGRWTVVADTDELLVCDLDRRTRLPDLVATPDFAGAEGARVFMLDMYPAGPLSEASFSGGDPFAEAGHVDRVPFRTNWPGLGTYSNGPTWTSALRHRLLPGSRPEIFVAQKIALIRYMPWMRLSAGLHYVADVRLATRELVFAHFKYNAEFRAKALAEVQRRQHFNDAEEYRKYLALLAEGRETLHDPELSVPWQDCEFVRSLLGGGTPEAPEADSTAAAGPIPRKRRQG